MINVYYLKPSIVKVFLILLILSILAILYFLFAPSVLWLSSSETGVKLKINGEDKGVLNKNKVMLMKPDTYFIQASKENFLDFGDTFLIKSKTKFVKKEIALSGGRSISAVPGGQNALGASFVSPLENQTITIFSDNAFYKISADTPPEKIPLDLKLGDSDKVLNMKFSPDKTKTILLTMTGSGRNVKIVNLDLKEITDISLLYDADWLSANEVIGIDKNDRKKIVRWDKASSLHEIASLSGEGLSISASADGKSAIIIGSENVSLLQLSDKSIKEVKFAGAFVSTAIALKNNQFAVLTMEKGQPRVYLINQNGDKRDLNIEPYLDNLVSYSADQILYVSYDKVKMTFDFFLLSVKDSKKRIVNSVFRDLGDPSDLNVNGNQAIYKINDSVMGFKIE